MLDQRRRKHAADLDILDNSHPASSNSLQRQRHALSHKVKVQAAQFECNAPQMIHEVSWLVPRCALAAGSTHSSLRRPNPVLRSSLVVSQIGVSQIGGLSDAKAFLTARVRQICVRQIRLSDAWQNTLIICAIRSNWNSLIKNGSLLQVCCPAAVAVVVDGR